jgi:pyruvate dehydrogenase E1 component alpha subunit
MGTSVERTTIQTDIYKLGLPYGIPSSPVDGMDPAAVHNAMDEAISRARAGEGPTFLEMRTYRLKVTPCPIRKNTVPKKNWKATKQKTRLK